jgi:DNA-binding HxlR family transcriptional regulator
MRYGELFESLEGISSRTLSLKLKRLEELKMIVKKEPAYAITLKGKKLAAIFAEMAKYGKKHL